MTDEERNDEQSLVQTRDTMRSLIREAGPQPGMEFINRFLEQPNAPQLVRSLEAEELYNLVLQLGRGDSADIVRYASPEQFHGILDLDCWDSHEFLPERTDAWLALAAEAGEETVHKMFDVLDDEMLGLYILRRAQVLSRTFEPEQDDELPDGQEVLTTPDNLFYIVLPADSPHLSLLKFFVNEWYVKDRHGAASVLKSLTFEDADVLESEARRFREGRLPAMGFPSYEEAEAVHTYINPDRMKAKVQQRLEQLAPFSVDTHSLMPTIRDFQESQPQFLKNALDAIQDDSLRERLHHGFIYLVHAVAVLDSEGDLGNMELREQSASRAFAISNLALQFLSDGQQDLASEILPRIWPKHLYRIGFSLLLQLKTRANKLVRHTGFEHGFLFFDPPLDQVIEGARQETPLYFEGLLEPAKRAHRDFRTFEDWRVTRGALRQARGVSQFVEKTLRPNPRALALKLPQDQRRAVTHTTLMATALINALLGHTSWLEPIKAEELTSVLDLVLLTDKDGNRTINPNLRSALDKFVQHEQNKFAAVLFELSLNKLQDVFLRLPKGVAPDPRFVAGALLVSE